MKYKLVGSYNYYGYWDGAKNLEIFLGDGSSPRATPYLFNTRAEAEFILDSLKSASKSLRIVELP